MARKTKKTKVLKTYFIDSKVDKDPLYFSAYDEKDAVDEFFRCIGPIPQKDYTVTEIAKLPKGQTYLNSGVLARR